MKKIYYLLLGLCCLLFMSACGELAKESPVEDFLYEMNYDEVIITGYKGTDLEIYIPSKINDRPVTTIGEDAFRGYDMTHVTIPDSVIVIESSAFGSCECLTSIYFSKSLEEVSESSFYGCEALTEVSLPESLKRIETSAFELCTSLKTVSLPNGLEYLGDCAFAQCDNLESLKIPDNTQIEIVVTGYSMIGAGVMRFSSPVGVSSVRYSDNTSNATDSNNKFSELPTKIIVTGGSYAYTQVGRYSKYGLTIEVA